MPTGSRSGYFTSFLVKIRAIGRWKICQQELTTCNCKTGFFHFVDWTRTVVKCTTMKNARAKCAKLLVFLLLIMQISCDFRRHPVLVGPSFCLVCLRWRDLRDEADSGKSTRNCDDDNAEENIYPHCNYFSFIPSCSHCTSLTKYATTGLQGEPLKWI